MSWPTLVEKRQWKPAQMRAWETSSLKARRLVNRWTTPGAVGLAIDTSAISSVPNTARTTPARLALELQWAQGHSGCIGVASIGCQAAARSVAGFRSLWPLQMAVAGRRNA